MQSDVISAQFSRLKAKAIQDSFNSTYKLLEEGEVDGEENTVSNIYSKKFYNLQKHMTISNHGYLGYAVMMSGKVWNEQSEETKKILLEAMEETTAWNSRMAFDMNEELLEKSGRIPPFRFMNLHRKKNRNGKLCWIPSMKTFHRISGRTWWKR